MKLKVLEKTGGFLDNEGEDETEEENEEDKVVESRRKGFDENFDWEGEETDEGEMDGFIVKDKKKLVRIDEEDILVDKIIETSETIQGLTIITKIYKSGKKTIDHEMTTKSIRLVRPSGKPNPRLDTSGSYIFRPAQKTEIKKTEKELRDEALQALKNKRENPKPLIVKKKVVKKVIKKQPIKTPVVAVKVEPIKTEIKKEGMGQLKRKREEAPQPMKKDPVMVDQKKVIQEMCKELTLEELGF
jgi:hypothetical protein